MLDVKNIPAIGIQPFNRSIRELLKRVFLNSVFVSRRLLKPLCLFWGCMTVTSSVYAQNESVAQPLIKQSVAPKAVRSAPSLQETAAAKLLAMALSTRIPLVLYEEKEAPWMGGKRSIKMTKAGAPVLNSSRDNMSVTLPVKASLRGNVNTDLMLLKVQADCQADFIAPAKLLFDVDFKQKPLKVGVSIAVTVPPVMANCEGYQLPVQQLIQAVVEQQKSQWEQNLQKQVNEALLEFGL